VDELVTQVQDEVANKDTMDHARKAEEKMRKELDEELVIREERIKF